jgi:anti-sigma factor RsiW
MSCSPDDVRDYVFDELAARERRAVERHLTGCPACRMEAEHLRATQTALLTVRDEEIPRRVAFVSDKIFEPSLLRRWWRAGWAPAGALIAAAIVFAALWHPQTAPVVAHETFTPAQVRAAISEEVTKAVAAVEERSARRTAELLAAAEKRYELDRQADRIAVEEAFTVLKKRLNVMYMASSEPGASR